MNKNVGSVDKVIRIILGAVIIGAGVSFKNWWGAIGAVPILTAFMGWGPAYSLLGIQTSSKSKV